MNETYSPQQIIPTIKSHKIGRSLELDCVTVKIPPEEWQVCDEVSRNYWSQKKRGQYGKGILNTQSDPAKTERTGLLGEMAFAKISGLDMDISYVEGGAAHDFTFVSSTGEELSIDIKTAHKLQPYKAMLIYAQSGSGKDIPLNSTYYVAGYIANEDIEAQKATVILIGYCHRDLVLSKDLVKGKQGFWLNKEIPYAELSELDGLLDLIQGDSCVISRKKEEEEECPQQSKSYIAAQMIGV